MEAKREGDESVGLILYPRLQYLLKLDTQASLSVLGAAFPEHGPLGVGTRDWIYGSGCMKPEHGDVNSHLQAEDMSFPTGEIVIEGLNLAQTTLDAVIRILQITFSAGETAESELTPTSADDQWPTGKDTGAMLEFVAHFAAGKYAVVTSAIMPRILEHLTSPVVIGPAMTEVSEKKLVIQQQREDLMVALLRAVPKSEWDAQRALHLAEGAGYWQV